MPRSWTLLTTYLGAIALAGACAGNGKKALSSDDDDGPHASFGGQSNAGGAGGFVGAPAGGAQSTAGQSDSATSAGRQSGVAGSPESIGGVSGVTPVGGAGGEVEPSMLPGACTRENVAPVEEDGGLVVKLKANSDRIDEFPQGEVQIANASNAGVPLSALEIRYYLESEYPPGQTDKLLVSVYHAQKRGLTYANVAPNQVLTDVVPIQPRVPGADAIVSIAFQGGAGQAAMLLPGETVLVQFGVHPPDGDDSYYRVPRDQTNDYSFGACPEYASTWPRVVLVVDGAVASGEPPPGLPTPGLPTPGEGGAGGQGSTDDEWSAGGAGGAG